MSYDEDVPTKTCEREGCSETFTYGLENRNTPRFCSFQCRDIALPNVRSERERAGGRR